MKTRQPNILLIPTDHFRRDTLGRSAPSLLRLAGEGTRFANAYYASPPCQPARVSLITKPYSSQT
jgi:arylsulfatase A-like enzyme